MLGNTYRNLEVICINDGSTDGSQAILQKYSDSDSRVQVIYKENGGVSSARNVGLDVAAGDYIAFVDSDDWVHNRFFETLLYFAKRDTADMIVCEFEKRSSVDNPDIIINFDEIITEPLDLKGCFRHNTKAEIWTHLYRRSLLEKVRFDENLVCYEDTAFNVVMLCAQEKIKTTFIYCPMYYYFQRESSLTHTVELRDETIIFSDAYKNKLESETICAQNKPFLLYEAIKEFLSYRYSTSFMLRGEKKKRNVIVTDRKRQYVKLLKTANVPIKERVMYMAFLYVPALYRIWRISIDRTMLDWEHIQKEKRKQQRRSMHK